MRSVVEGAFIANFDPDIYRSDRKDLRMKDVTVVAPQVLIRDSFRSCSTRDALSANRRTLPVNW